MSTSNALSVNKSKGFTLVELLVSITILAILAAIGLITYSMALRQGRDSKRQSDLKAIQSALEQYNSDQFFYPTSDLNNFLDDSPPPSLTNCKGSPSPCTVSKTYLNSLPQDPTDPTGSKRYRYDALPAACDNSTTATRCTGYCLYAVLENLASPAPLPSGCVYPAGGYNFAVGLP